MMFLRVFGFFTSILLASALLAGRQDTQVTGDTSCYGGAVMCVSATLNGSTVQYTLSTSETTLGWMALGFGQQMAGSSMVILWINNNVIVVSQRTASGEFEPTVTSNPTNVATLNNNLSVLTAGSVQFVFTMDAPASTTQPIIYSFSSHNPGSGDVGATLVQHDEYYQGSLDLSAALSSSGGGSSSNGSSSGDSSSSSSGGIPLTQTDRIILVHAVLCTLGFLVCLPAGALLARYLRTFNPSWFVGHWILQFAISAPVIIVGVVMGIYAISQAKGIHFDDTHKKWGITIFALYFAQCGLGAFIHWVKPKYATRRPPQNYLHAVFGIIIIGLAMYQVRTGCQTEWPKVTGRGPVSKTANIVWYVWIVLLPILYFAGLAFLPKQYRQERLRREGKA